MTAHDRLAEFAGVIDGLGARTPPGRRHEPGVCAWCNDCDHYASETRRLTDERDAWIRKYTRLEGAVNAHEKADRFKDDHDQALYRVRDKLNEPQEGS